MASYTYSLKDVAKALAVSEALLHRELEAGKLTGIRSGNTYVFTLRDLERYLGVKQARALFAYGSESITNQAFWLGISEMVATYEWFVLYLENLESIKPEDVQRAASTYLLPKNRVSGVYVPTGNGQPSLQ